jgi:hypothetical protein
MALSHADLKLERGDVRAFGPTMKILAALQRFTASTGVCNSPT